ncbi:MAG: YARHG domain-containing protein [Prevotella sp.]
MTTDNNQSRKIWASVASVAVFLLLTSTYMLLIVRPAGKSSDAVAANTTTVTASDTVQTSTETAVQTSDASSTSETATDVPASDASAQTSSADLPGQYAVASMRLLTESDVAGMSSAELKIMRNEIFARHGYIFKTKSMKDHFAAQPWYSGRYDDVSDKLSEIETKNVAFIKKHE